MKLLPVFKTITIKAADKVNRLFKRTRRTSKSDLSEMILHNNDEGSRRKRNSYYSEHEEVEDHFQELLNTSDFINSDLERQGLPYRFDIVKNGIEIYIELLFLDKEGGIIESKTQKITHKNFREIVQKIDEGEGLLFEDIV